jgi:hypothetical protein
MTMNSGNVPSYPQTLWITLCRKLRFLGGAAQNRNFSCTGQLVIRDLSLAAQSLAATFSDDAFAARANQPFLRC